MALSLLDRPLTFAHGVHPGDYKEFTERLPLQRLPFGEEYIIPVQQHIGAPSLVTVRKGQKVRRGDVVAKANGFVSVAQHSPVDGVVKEIGLWDHPGGGKVVSVVIQADPFSPQEFVPRPLDWQSLSKKEFLRLLQEGGLVGLGGAAFPSHVKFSIPEGKKCETLILNGCECEPFLTSDHKLMAEFPEKVVLGAKVLASFLGAEKIYAGIEINKPDALEALERVSREEGVPLEVVPLEVKYPQGAEKMLITAILGCEVPSGKLPIDVGAVVSNVGTIAALWDLVSLSKPLMERVVTVTGPAIEKPANLLVPLGTPLEEVLQFCGGLRSNARWVLLGGPMMGVPQKSFQAPVVKGTSGILALRKEDVQEKEVFPCIRCAKCVEACPVFLNPSYLGLLAKKGLYDHMAELHVLDCIECGSCSYVCPSGIPLVQYFRVAKGILRERRKA